MREYDLWLGLLEIPNLLKLNLYRYFNNDTEYIYKAGKKKILESGLCDVKTADKIVVDRNKINSGIIDYMDREKINYLSINEKMYPDSLRNIYDPPFGLFYKGNFPKSFDYSIAIVGARHCSVYGQGMAAEISGTIAEYGGMIVSGMARGIDTIAHIGALNNSGVTLGILGCGVDICYPKGNHRVYNDIIKNGCIISEFPPKTPPLPYFFPMRNRIISGLSKAVIVVEAANKSGSLITADFALEQGKEVFALPGRTVDRLSCGSNKLIEQGAGIILSTDDLMKTLCEMKLLPCKTETGKEKTKRSINNIVDSLSEDEKLLISKMEYQPVGIDLLIYETGMDLGLLLRILTALQNKNIIKQEQGLYYLNTVTLLI